MPTHDNRPHGREAGFGELQRAERILLTAVRTYRIDEFGVAAREACLAVERAAAAWLAARGIEADSEGPAAARRMIEAARGEAAGAETAAVEAAEARSRTLWAKARDDIGAAEALESVIEAGKALETIAEALELPLARGEAGIEAWALWHDLAGSAAEAETDAAAEPVLLSPRAKGEEREAVEAELRALSPESLEAAVQATQGELQRLESAPHDYSTAEAARVRRRLLGGLEALTREIRRRGLDIALSPRAERRIQALRAAGDAARGG